jgi:glutamine synthetase
LAYALFIDAGLYGIEQGLVLPESADMNLFTADEETLRSFRRLPASRAEAADLAAESAFLKERLPALILNAYTGR